MPANNDLMGRLHQRLAEVMLQMLEPTVTPVYDPDDPEIIVDERVTYPAPAVLAAATTFLKNNNITSIVEDDPALSKLRDKLKSRGRITDADTQEAIKSYAGRLQ